MPHRRSCSSVGRAGWLVIRRSLVQIPAPAELHVEVSLSKILNPKLLLMCACIAASAILCYGFANSVIVEDHSKDDLGLPFIQINIIAIFCHNKRRP